MDFVIKISESMGFDTVMTVVDSVFKRMYFVLTHTTVTIEIIARLFLYYVWKLHSLST